jgi:hypothetical protein
MTGDWFKKALPPRRDPPGPLQRAVRPAKQPKKINPINRERKNRVDAKTFGPQARAARLLPCCVCARRPCDPAHVVSRGAGGTDSDVVPLCKFHHREQHDIGIQSFQARHNIVLEVVAAELAKNLKEHECCAWPVLTETERGMGYSCALCERDISDEEFGK